jgi:hypothetical protein
MSKHDNLPLAFQTFFGTPATTRALPNQGSEFHTAHGSGNHPWHTGNHLSTSGHQAHGARG